MELKNGAELQNGKYRIIRVLGQGGFGITYLAEHTMLDKKVAIKEFFPKQYCDRNAATSHVTVGTQSNQDLIAKLKNRFLKEAKNISKLRHPGIISIHDIFEENNSAYYVMDFIEGESLSEIIKREGSMTEHRALEYIKKVGEALEYIHSRNMTHFDVKPANIMVRKEDDFPILIDFGLSKQYSDSGEATTTGLMGVSRGFSAIELTNLGELVTFSEQSDVYSLGATLLYLLTGTIPPDASALVSGSEDLSIPSSVSPSTARAIESAMEVNRRRRTPDVRTFLSQLDNNEATAPETFQSSSEEPIKSEMRPEPIPDCGLNEVKTPSADETAILESPSPSDPTDEEPFVKKVPLASASEETAILEETVKQASTLSKANSGEEITHHQKQNSSRTKSSNISTSSEIHETNPKGKKVSGTIIGLILVAIIGICIWFLVGESNENHTFVNDVSGKSAETFTDRSQLKKGDYVYGDGAYYSHNKIPGKTPSSRVIENGYNPRAITLIPVATCNLNEVERYANEFKQSHPNAHIPSISEWKNIATSLYGLSIVENNTHSCPVINPSHFAEHTYNAPSLRIPKGNGTFAFDAKMIKDFTKDGWTSNVINHPTWNNGSFVNMPHRLTFGAISGVHCIYNPQDNANLYMIYDL